MRRKDSIDLTLMDRALELAERGRYGVSPNPMVGAVVARSGAVVAEAFHRRAGGPHAEAAALELAGERARGADLYVTLEPCAHLGRTPPCAEAILRSRVARVIVASRDPNPLVRGRGLALLRRAGVPVLWADAGRRARAEAQNEKFRLWMTKKRPFVLAKWASSIDGRIATAAGESRWITGPAARRWGWRLREEYDAVLVGAGTVLADDPLLTRRLGLNSFSAHRRVVLDGALRVDPGARLFAKPEECLVVTARPLTDPAARRFQRRRVEVWSLPARRAGAVDLAALLERLAQRDVSSLMVEGGARTHGEFFRAGLVDRVAVFLAPRVLGGDRAAGAVGGRGFSLETTPRLTGVRVQAVGDDWLITGRVGRRPEPRSANSKESPAIPPRTPRRRRSTVDSRL